MQQTKCPTNTSKTWKWRKPPIQGELLNLVDKEEILEITYNPPDMFRKEWMEGTSSLNVVDQQPQHNPTHLHHSSLPHFPKYLHIFPHTPSNMNIGCLV